jgi:hypothetical protein
VVVFSTRRPIESLDALLTQSGYVEMSRATSTVSTFLIEYARAGRAVSAGSVTEATRN